MPYLISILHRPFRSLSSSSIHYLNRHHHHNVSPVQPCWDLFPRHDDVPTRDNFDSSSNPRIPGVYPGITSSAGFGAESHSVVYGDGAVGGGGGAGAVGIPGAAWSVMPESFSFNLNEQSASVLSTKKLVKIVNMGPKPLRL